MLSTDGLVSILALSGTPAQPCFAHPQGLIEYYTNVSKVEYFTEVSHLQVPVSHLTKYLVGHLKVGLVKNFTFYDKYKLFPNSEDENYNLYISNCQNLSGGFNNYGLDQSLNSMITMIKQYYSDMKNIIEMNKEINGDMCNFRENLNKSDRFILLVQKVFLTGDI